MKKNISYFIAFLVAFLLILPANAAPKKKQSTRYYDTHFIDAWVGGGYSGLLNKYQGGQTYGVNLTPKFMGGGGALIGFGYEYHYKRFMLNVGPEFRMFSSTDKLMLDQPLQAYRTDYSTMLQHFEFNKFRETSAIGQVTLPVMFGGTFDQVYFLAGAKVGYTLLHSWKHRGNLTTSVTDDMAYDDEWNDLFSHYIQTEKLTEHPLNNTVNQLKGSNPFGLDIMLSAEVGVNLNGFLPRDWSKKNEKSAHPHHFRVAAFVDYGLWNMNVAKAGASSDLVTINPAAAEDGLSESASLHQSSYAEGKRVNSLLAGVKGTWLLQLNKPAGRKPLTPQLAVKVAGVAAGQPVQIGQSVVKIQSNTINSKTKKPSKPKAFNTNGKGEMLRQLRAGEYTLWVEKPGYFTSDTVYDYEMVVPPFPENRREKPAPQRLEFNLIQIPTWTVTVKDQKTGAPISGAHLHLASAVPGLLEAELKTDTNGVAKYTFQDKAYLNQEYKLHISAANFHSADAELAGNDIYGSNEYTLSPIVRIRHKLILNHMYFATDKTDILPRSESDILKLYNFLSENPKIRVLITGHTDSQGSEQHNQVLSEGRAASLKAEMIKRGIDGSRIETNGKGELEPIDTNETEEGRQNNRRVEVTVLNEDEAEEDVY